MFAGSTYDTLLIIASEMILVPYFLVGAFVLKIAIEERNRGSLLFIGLGATLYGLWLLYASGLNYLLLSAILYLPGLYFYIQAKKEQGVSPFLGREKVAAGMLGAIALFSVAMIWQGSLSIAF
jgi:arginine:ornithine antiporter/lysine permease